MLAGIVAYRLAVARIVRQERRYYDQPIPRDIDVSVSVMETVDNLAEGLSRDAHRRLACEAKAELWKNIHSGEVDNADDRTGESVQVFEEWSHTE